MDWLNGIPLVGLAIVVGISSLSKLKREAVAIAVVLAIVGLNPSLASQALTPISFVAVSVGWVILAASLKRSGLVAWVALGAAKLARGRPQAILALLAIITFAFSSLLGPLPAVGLVVPVGLLLAVELDVAVLPFVLTLSWSALLGGASAMTAQPASLWLAATVHVSSVDWLTGMLPWTVGCLAVTLLLAATVFRKSLRVTNERRARVLEYDLSRSLGSRRSVSLSLLVLAVAIAGLILGPIWGLPSWVAVWSAVALLWLGDQEVNASRGLAEVDGAPFVFVFCLLAAASFAGSTELVRSWAIWVPHDPWSLLGVSALASAFLDPQAVISVAASVLGSGGDQPITWVPIVLGSGLGGGITVWGVASSTAALSLAGTGRRSPGAKDFARYGLLFGLINGGWVALAMVYFRPV